jgi:hypothetical protein
LGGGELGVRLLALACWPLTAGLLALLARRLARQADDWLPLWVALLFMCGPLASLLGLVATTDGPLLLAWSGALLGLWLAVAERRAGGWALWAVALALGLLDKYSMAAILPGAFVWTLWMARRSGDVAPQFIRFAGASALAGLALIPHLLWNAEAGWPTLQHTADITLRSASAQGGLLGLVIFVGGQLLAAGPLLGWAAWRARDDARPMAPVSALLLAAAVPLLAAGLWQGWKGHVEINWIAPAQLSLLLWVALLSQRLPRRAALIAVALQLTVMSVLVLLPPFAQQLSPQAKWPTRMDASARMRGWGPAFDALGQALPGTEAVIVSPNRGLLAHAAYHWRERAVVRAALAGPGRPLNHYEMSCPWRAGLAAGRPVFLLTEGPAEASDMARFERVEPLLQAPLVRLGGTVHTTLHLARVWPRAEPAQAGEVCR